MVTMKTLCMLNFIFVHKKSKNQEIKTGTTLVLLSWSGNMIERFMKTYLHKPIKILRFLKPRRIQKFLT